MRAIDVADYLERAKVSEPEDSFWCRNISIPLLNCLLHYPILDRAMALIIATGSASIAFKQAFLPEQIGDNGGKAMAVICNLAANTAIFLDFRLSDGLVRGIRAERRIRKMSAWRKNTILAAWWGTTLVCLPGGIVAQAYLTGSGMPEGVSQVLSFLGGLGFLATRGATFSRGVLHFTVDPDLLRLSSDSAFNPPSWWETMLEHCLPIGSRSHLPWDEKIVDVVSSTATLAFMVGGRWIWTDMYRLKLVNGLLGLGLDLCGENQGCKDSYLYYVTSILSCLSYFYFYFPAQDAIGHLYRFCKAIFNYFEKRGWRGAMIALLVALFVIGVCGAGSETGLVASRVFVNLYLAEAYFFLVNTPSLLKKFAELLISKVSVVDDSEHTLSSSAGYSLTPSHVHPGIHGLKKPLIAAAYSSLDVKPVTIEIKNLKAAEAETPEKEKSCCNIFRVWGRLKERYYGASVKATTFAQMTV
jgi:hypothetical protein